MSDIFTTLPERQVPAFVHSSRWKRQLLSSSLQQPLDRVNVLGDESTGHTGYVFLRSLLTPLDCKYSSESLPQSRCVNALSWAKDGEVLLSGGDDTT